MRTACKIPGCEKAANNGGGSMCSMHYSRLRRTGSPYIRTKRIYLTHQECTVEGCGNKIAGNGLCGTHWMQNKRRGDPLAPHLHEPDWTPAEDKVLMRHAARGPEPWVKGAMADLGRTYSACSSRAYGLRHGIRQTKAV